MRFCSETETLSWVFSVNNLLKQIVNFARAKVQLDKRGGGYRRGQRSLCFKFSGTCDQWQAWYKHMSYLELNVLLNSFITCGQVLACFRFSQECSPRFFFESSIILEFNMCVGVFRRNGLFMGALGLEGWLLTHPTQDYRSVPAVKHSRPPCQVWPAHLDLLPSLYPWPAGLNEGRLGINWGPFHQVQLSLVDLLTPLDSCVSSPYK